MLGPRRLSAATRTFRLAALAGKKTFRLSGTGFPTTDAGTFDPAKIVSLRITREAGEFVFSAQAEGGDRTRIGSVMLPEGQSPSLIRIGKLDAEGGGSDAKEPETRCA